MSDTPPFINTGVPSEITVGVVAEMSTLKTRDLRSMYGLHAAAHTGLVVFAFAPPALQNPMMMLVHCTVTFP